MRRSLLAAPLIAAIVFGACDEASAPEGRAGDVTVLAFIDNDASGSMTAGDQPVAGLEITISRDGTLIAIEGTDAAGSVTFAGLPPGSYRVESSGALPAGATLVSNSEPTAVINFRGDAVTVAFQYAMLPGRISGLLLREGDNAPAEGVLVVLKRAGSVDTLARATTSATGAYEFRLLAPGDYVLEFEQAGAINYGASGRTRTVTVGGGGAASVNVAYTGSVFITVAAARAAPLNQVVAVIADVTVPGGRFTSSTGNVRSEIWVQDDNAGIAVFFVPTADSALYPIGQRVEVVGLRSANGLEPQIGTAASPPTTGSCSETRSASRWILSPIRERSLPRPAERRAGRSREPGNVVHARRHRRRRWRLCHSPAASWAVSSYGATHWVSAAREPRHSRRRREHYSAELRPRPRLRDAEHGGDSR